MSRDRGPRRRRPAPRARPVPAALRRPERPARPVHRDGPRRDDEGRPDDVHGLHAVRPQPRRGPRAGRRPARRRRAPSRRRPACRSSWAAARRMSPTSSTGSPPTSRGRALFIVVTTYLVLFLLLRSAVLPLKALVMNTLSIVASFGALVWIFQDGNLSSVLGFQPLGFVETTQPVILFCVLFGLSMDYEVFLLSRMKEVWDQTGDNTEAVARGLERSGRIVTSAALIVVVVARLVRVRRHRPDQGARDRHGDRGGPRRDGRPGAARAGDDAAPRQVELVGARVGPAGAGRRDGGAAARARRSPAAAARSSPPRRPPIRRRRPRPTPRPATAGPDPDRPAARRRAARPPDRVVVLHGPPPRRDGRPVRVRVRDLPRRARRAAGVVGVAPRADRRDRRDVPLRPADVDRARRRRSSAEAFDLAIPDPAGDRRWSMAGGDGRRRADRATAAEPGGRAGAGFALELAVESAKPAALHDTDGWIDFGPAGGVVLLLADGDGRRSGR